MGFIIYRKGLVNMFKTQITELFGITHPIIQGGMQHVSRPKLVAAVSNAGGLGILTASNYDSGEKLVEAIRETRERTDRPFGLNLSTSAAPELLERNIQIVLDEKIGIVETSGRNPGNIVAPLKAAGVKLFHKIPSVRFAKKLEEQGFDAIAVVGHQAGGHPGPFGVTSELVLLDVLDTVTIPVIMGGGVYDGRGLAAALAYGAEGVLMGTRFLAAKEAEISQNIREWMLGAKSTDTLMVKSDNPNRVAKTAAAYRVLGMEHGGKTLDEIGKLMLTMKGRDSWENGDPNRYLQSMGQVCGLIHEIKSCREIIEEMVAQAGEMTGRLSGKMV